MKKKRKTAVKTKSRFSFRESKALPCKLCSRIVENCDSDAVRVTCSRCVVARCLKRMPLEEMMPSLKKKDPTGRPAGWHFMNEFVDVDGSVFHKGKEQPELKGTLPLTKIKPRKKKKKLTADEKLFQRVADWKKRKQLKKS